MRFPHTFPFADLLLRALARRDDPKLAPLHELRRVLADCRSHWWIRLAFDRPIVGCNVHSCHHVPKTTTLCLLTLRSAPSIVINFKPVGIMIGTGYVLLLAFEVRSSPPFIPSAFLKVYGSPFRQFALPGPYLLSCLQNTGAMASVLNRLVAFRRASFSGPQDTNSPLGLAVTALEAEIDAGNAKSRFIAVASHGTSTYTAEFAHSPPRDAHSSHCDPWLGRDPSQGIKDPRRSRSADCPDHPSLWSLPPIGDQQHPRLL